MDTTASVIHFDEAGRCNYCSDFIASLATPTNAPGPRTEQLATIVADIRAAGKGSEYDCVVGVSGGLDSSYALYNACELGLRPLAVHMDNGWNSELAVSNIERLVRELSVDLYTYVLDWDTFRDLQRAFFKAHVVDIEMLTDNAIFAILHRIAHRRQIKYILVGTNRSNEGLRIPPEWNHLKLDRRNIKAIYRRHGTRRPLKGVPLQGLSDFLWSRYVRRIKLVPILEYLSYDTGAATRVLQDSFRWRPHGRKHYESVFTRFYQAFILPEKFGVDKRKVHLSALICSGEMSREEALESLQDGAYSDRELLESDKAFVLKKLGLTEEEFASYIHAPPVSHYHYPSIAGTMRRLLTIKRKLASFAPGAPMGGRQRHQILQPVTVEKPD